MKENQHIEYKTSWRDEYLKWICGFANASGGVLVNGMDDKSGVMGLPNAAKLLEDIPNKVRDILGIMVEVNLYEEAGREYLAIVVEPYPYPVSYKGEYHYRSGSTKQELKGAALDRFLLRKQGLHWDGVPIPHVTIRDLSVGEKVGEKLTAIRNAYRVAGNTGPTFRYDNELWVEFALQEAKTPVETPVKTLGKTLVETLGKAPVTPPVAPPVTPPVTGEVTDKVTGVVAGEVAKPKGRPCWPHSKNEMLLMAWA